MQGLARFHLDTKEWGRIQILRPLPRDGDPWGVLAPLRETPWGAFITIVQGPSLSHALHGYSWPLAQELGRDPLVLARLVPREVGRCLHAQNKTCTTIRPECLPGPETPDCYEAPGEHSQLSSLVVLSWKKGTYVLVVEGEEF